MDSLEQKQRPPINLVQGTDLPVVHANQILVQHTAHELVVTFFEVLPPVLSGNQAQEGVDNGETQPLQARPVARIVMSDSRAHEFAVELVENLRATNAETDPVEHRLLLALENKVHSEVEPEEEWLVHSGMLQELLTNAAQQHPVEDWERLLDEL